MSIAESANVSVRTGPTPSSKTRELARAILSGTAVHPEEIPAGRAYTTLRDLATHPGLRDVTDVLNRPGFRSYRFPCPAVAGRPDSRSA